jgi:Uma2 family endonuclease
MADVAVDRWEWTADTYETAGAAGLFGPDDKVELLDGEVVKVASMLPGHASTMRRLLRHFAAELDPVTWALGSQTPIRLDGRSEPEPDLWIARGPDDGYDERHPTPDDLVLVVEVSDTSLAFDRDVKIPLYATAGVPEVWIVSLPERGVRRYRDPAPGGYRSLQLVESGILSVAGVDVPVDAIIR